MAKSKKAGAKRIIDVEQPDKSPPSGNSKSVIVSNRPLLKDPMMLESKPEIDGQPPVADDDKSSKEPEAKLSDAPTIGSLTATAPLLKTEEDDDQPEPAKTPETKPDSEKPVETAAPPPEPAEADPAEAAPEPPVAKPDKPEIKPAAADKAEKPEKADKPEPPEPDKPEPEKPGSSGEESPKSTPDNTRQAEIEAAEQAKHQAGIDKLADSKKYFLPINAVEKRRSKRFVALGILLSLLLAAAWVNIALDAGLIELNGLKPLTHFFST